VDFLFQFFFPVRCSGCQAYESSGFCSVCQNKLPKDTVLFSIPHVLQGAALGFYAPPLEQAVRDLKFNHQKIIGKTLGKMVGFMVREKGWDFHCIAPVPMDKKRWQKRGYNQAEVIGMGVSSVIGKPCKNILRTIRLVSHQVGLGRGERLKNVAGAFGVREREAVSGRSFLLVDDVVTTGATLSECAEVLMKSGAESVYAACAARDALNQS
jgi:ComF family protein